MRPVIALPASATNWGLLLAAPMHPPPPPRGCMCCQHCTGGVYQLVLCGTGGVAVCVQACTVLPCGAALACFRAHTVFGTRMPVPAVSGWCAAVKEFHQLRHVHRESVQSAPCSCIVLCLLQQLLSERAHLLAARQVHKQCRCCQDLWTWGSLLGRCLSWLFCVLVTTSTASLATTGCARMFVARKILLSTSRCLFCVGGCHWDTGSGARQSPSLLQSLARRAPHHTCWNCCM